MPAARVAVAEREPRRARYLIPRDAPQRGEVVAALTMLALVVYGGADMVSVVIRETLIQMGTPDAMRGRVTAIYLFMFIFFGAFGGQMIGSITQRVFGSDADLWKSIVLTASILLPLAAFTISRGVKPYGREVERLEKLEAERGAMTSRPA